MANEPTLKPAASIGVSTAKRTPPAHNQPPKSEQWAFRDVQGTKETVLSAIAASSAPEPVKAYLKFLVESSTMDWVVLDAQGHLHDGKHVSHSSVTGRLAARPPHPAGGLQ